jgi:hypothetical protein
MKAMKLCEAIIRIRWLKEAIVLRNISVQFYYEENRHVYGNKCLFILQSPEHGW